jgi:predicted enzyme related to lactoylglutathione lyase
VNWFEIPVSDMLRATKFYEAVFGGKLAPPTPMGPFLFAFFPMERGGAGAAGTLVKGEGHTPSHQGTMVYFSVAAIDASMKKIDKAGGKILVPRQSIGQYGFIGIFEDTEGNRVALHECVKEST